jgi:hypothetical protein
MDNPFDDGAKYRLANSLVVKDLERAGEAKVRDQMTRGLLDAQTEMVARKWLQVKERERADASQAEQIEIARSAKDAAWAAAEAARDAAREAKTANIIATLALIGAAIAIAVSIVAAFLR